MTRRSRAAALVVAAALALVAGCSEGSVPSGRASPDRGNGGTIPSSAPGSPAGGRTRTPSPSLSAGNDATNQPKAGATPNRKATVYNNDFRLEIGAPDCARIGGTLPVTVRTEPEADVALIVAFSDSEAHDAYRLGTADTQGVFSTQIPIPVSAPEGEAQLLVSVGREGKGNSGQKPFAVVGTTEPCP